MVDVSSLSAEPAGFGQGDFAVLDAFPGKVFGRQGDRGQVMALGEGIAEGVPVHRFGVVSGRFGFHRHRDVDLLDERTDVPVFKAVELDEDMTPGLEFGGGNGRGRVGGGGGGSGRIAQVGVFHLQREVEYKRPPAGPA